MGNLDSHSFIPLLWSPDIYWNKKRESSAGYFPHFCFPCAYFSGFSFVEQMTVVCEKIAWLDFGVTPTGLPAKVIDHIPERYICGVDPDFGVTFSDPIARVSAIFSNNAKLNFSLGRGSNSIGQLD
jgi:hypothetical protein